MQARLRHQREQSRRLERDGLAARVGPGDQEHARRRIDDDVDGNDVAALPGVLEPAADRADEQRMPRLAQLQAAVDGDLGRDPVHDRSEARFRLQHVEVHRDVERGAQIVRARAEGVGQLEQDAADLFALALFELDDVVVDLDRRRGLEEEARAARRASVHDARHVAPVLGSHHQHVTAVSLGDDLLLQVLRRVLAAHELIERRPQPLAFLPQLVAHPAEQRAGVIEHLAAWVDGVTHSADLVLEARRARHDAVEDGKDARRLAHGVSGELHRIEEIGDAPQWQRLEDLPGHAEPIQRLVQAAPGTQREERVALQIGRRLAGRVEGRGDGFWIGGWLQRRQAPPRRAASAPAR